MLVFSPSVSAEPVDVPPFTVTHTVNTSWYGNYESGFVEFTPYDGVTTQSFYRGPEYTQFDNEPLTVISTFSFVPIDGGVFLANEGKTTMLVTRIVKEFSYIENGQRYFEYNPESCRLLLFYNDGSMEYVDNVTQDNWQTISATFTPQKNVVKLEIIMQHTFVPSNGSTFQVVHALGEYQGDTLEFTIDQESEQTGLLKTIIEWLRSIKDGITNVFDSIAELPSKIWQFIENGLKSLFVPDEQFIVDYKDEFDTMLSEKLGAVYQVVNITFGSLERIQEADEANHIELPETTIDLPDNNKFSFGGYDVPIVPEGFGFIADIIKTVVGAVCTVLFINGLRRRYDEIMGVNQ